MTATHITRPRAPSPGLPARQRGIVLVVGLVFLLVLTIIGVTSLRTTTLQERMAGNLQQSTIAFQDSEARIAALIASLNANVTALSANDACPDDGSVAKPEMNPDPLNAGKIASYRTCPEFIGESTPGRLTDTAEGGQTKLLHFRIESQSTTVGNAKAVLHQGVYQRGPASSAVLVE